MDSKTQIAKIILTEAKRQYNAGEINVEEYEGILTLLYDKLGDIENDLTKKEYIIKVFSEPFRTELKQTLNFSLSLN